MLFSGLSEQKSEEWRTAVAQKEGKAAHAAREKIKKAQRACLHFQSSRAKTEPRRSISHPGGCRNFLEKQAHSPRPSIGKRRQENRRTPSVRNLCHADADAARQSQGKTSFSLAPPLAFCYLWLRPRLMRLGKAKEKRAFPWLCSRLCLSLYAYLYIGTAHPLGKETNKQTQYPT